MLIFYDFIQVYVFTTNHHLTHVRLVDRCEKTSLINLVVLFCVVHFAFVGKKRMIQNAVSDQITACTVYIKFRNYWSKICLKCAAEELYGQ